MKIEKLEDLQKIISENKKVLVKISTETCGPCRVVKNIIENLEKKRTDVVFVNVDAENCDEDLLERFDVKGVPVIKVFTNGEESSSSVGFQTEDQITNRL